MTDINIDYKGETFKIRVPDGSTVSNIKQTILKERRLPVLQQQLSYRLQPGEQKSVLSDDLMPVSMLKLSQAGGLVLKNLGSQMAWDNVFYVEYVGPIVIFAACYWAGDRENYSWLQKVLFGMGILHFVKRELETLFVHVFSRNSMPLHRALINMLHYWILFGLLVGVELFFFWSEPKYSFTVVWALVALWAICEYMNLMCHIELSSFRKKAAKEKSDGGYVNPAKVRGIPKGFGFSLVSCANYFWESMGWIAFSLLSRCYTSYFFTFCSIYQMYDWARKKHSNYRKEFPEYPKNRKAMIPFIA